MKGLFFNLAQEVVEDRWGADRWDDAVELAGVDGAYTWLGTYPDADLFAIVRALSQLTDLSPAEVLVVIGRGGFPLLAAHHAPVLELVDGWRSMLLGLDDIIHPEALAVHAGATPPRFGPLGAGPDDSVLLQYRSDRALCALADGLVLGAGDWYGTPLTVVHRMCVHRGDASCVLEVTERRAPAPSPAGV